MSDLDGQGNPGGALPGETAAAELPRLLTAAAKGDEDAWRAVVHLYARRVYALARSRLCSSPGYGGGARGRSGGGARGAGGGPFVRGHDAAEEVTQSVFVTVASKLSSGQYTEQGRFESWLFRVAMNRIRDEIRRSRRQAAPTDPEALDAATPSSSVAPHRDARRDDLESLREAMDRLSEQDREVIELRHHAGLSFKQMADLLAEPIGTLLARHHRSLRKLKDLMTPGRPEPARGAGDTP